MIYILYKRIIQVDGVETQMDWKTFTSDLIKTLVWPGCFVFFCICFRSELARLIARVSKIKSKVIDLELNALKESAELRLGNSIQQVPALLDRAAAGAPTTIAKENLKMILPAGDEIKLLLEFATKKPTEACRNAWNLIFHSLGMLEGYYGRSIFIADLAIGLGALSASPLVIDAARRLTEMNERISFGEVDVSVESAKEFILLCGALIVDVEKLLRQSSN